MKNNESKLIKWTLISISALFLVVMLVLPLIYVLVTALRSGIDIYWEAITNTYALKAVILTIEVTIIAVIVNTIFGLYAAWAITKFHFRGKKLLSTLIDLPLTILL